MDWELTKENCVPVRQGRSKVALQELADPATEAIEAKRRELWAEVAEYKGDDPLEPWQRYIKWMQEYGVGGGKADLLKVLEACTKELLKHQRYNNDIRFLRIWIQYADCLPDPGDVFLFLKEKGIGRGFALYYEAYATYFELRGNFQSADAVYTDGVQRGAKPLDRLKQKHTAFQQRMAQRAQRRMQDEQALGPAASEPVRASLSAVGAWQGTRSNAAGQHLPSVFGADAPRQPIPLFGSRGPQSAAQDQSGAKGPPIGLLEDEEFRRGGSGLLGLPGYSSMPQVSNLRELKPFGVVRKENLDRPVAWNQAALQLGAAAPVGGTGGGGLDIFTDEEFQEGCDDKAGPALKAMSSGSVSAAPSGSHPLLFQSAEPDASAGVSALMFSLAPPPALLRAMPVAIAHTAAESLAAQTQPSAAARDGSGRDRLLKSAVSVQGDASTLCDPGVSCSGPPGLMAAAAVHAPAATGPTSMAGQRPYPYPQATYGWGQGSLQDDDGIGEEEMSYEELRAAAWFRHNVGPCDTASYAVSTAGRTASNETAGGSCASAASTRASVEAACAASQSSSRGVSGDWDADRRPATADENGRTASAGPRRLPFGQVANSLVAQEEEQQQRQGPMLVPVEDLGGSRSAASAAFVAADASRPKVRSRGDATPAMPEGTAQHPAPGISAAAVVPGPAPTALEHAGTRRDKARGCSTTRQDDAQSTVTISTRGAFDLLNSMFNEDLPHQQRRALQQKPVMTVCAQLATATAVAAPPVSDTQEPCVGGAVPARGPAQRAASGPVVAPLAGGSTCEPTVTLHTRLAFDALNDMFSDTLPHEAARKVVRQVAAENSAASSNRRFVNVEECCPAIAVKAVHAEVVSTNGRGTSGAFARKASCPVAAPKMAPVLAVHEDTFFLGPAAAALSVGDSRSGCPGMPMARQPQAQTQKHEAPAVYEDTEFMPGTAPRKLAGGSGSQRFEQELHSGAFILEDTEFMTRPQEHIMAASSGRFAAAGTVHVSATTTQETVVPQSRMQSDNVAISGFASRPTGLAGGVETSRVPADRSGRVYGSATQKRGNSRSHGGLQIYEDTQYLG